MQGYDTQAVCIEDEIVIAAGVTVDSPDFGHLERMIRAAEAELRRADVERSPDVVVADAGYWHQVQMERLAGDGLTVLTPPDATNAPKLGPAGTAASMPSCVGSWPPTPAASSMPSARR